MKFDPRKVPDSLIERAANAMQGANALAVMIDAPWDKVEARERDHWLYLAKAALISISIHTAEWPLLATTESNGVGNSE